MKLTIVYLLLLLPISFLHAQTLKQRLEKAYTKFEQDEQLKYSISSLTVLDARTGELIFSKNGGIGLAPASTLKTVTAATALDILGESFTWETKLAYTGQIKAGVLSGDLLIIGAGDPCLGSNRFPQTNKSMLLKKWIEATRSAGIRKIEGRILVDDQLFGTQTLPDGWIWQDIGNYYGAGSSAISWNENQFELEFKPSSLSSTANIVRSTLISPDIQLINEVITGAPGSGDQVYAYSAPYSNIIYLRGSYGSDLNKIIQVVIPDPAYELAFTLQDTLKGLGISSSQEASTTRRLSAAQLALPSNSQILDRYQSPNLSQIVYALNQKSINLYGEILLKTLAWKEGKPINTAEGVKMIQNYWAQKLSIDSDALNFRDGSGLSPENRITTISMAKILAFAQNAPWYNSFYKSLPIINQMHMKSGSVYGVLAYAGYHTSPSGIPLTYSFIINNYRGSKSRIRQKMYSLLDVLKQ